MRILYEGASNNYPTGQKLSGGCKGRGEANGKKCEEMTFFTQKAKCHQFGKFQEFPP